MATQEQIELMARYGFTLTNENPLIFTHGNGDYLTGRAAELLIESLRLNQVMNKRLHQLEARLNQEL